MVAVLVKGVCDCFPPVYAWPVAANACARVRLRRERTINTERVHKLLLQRAKRQEGLLRHKENVSTQLPLLPSARHIDGTPHVWPQSTQHAHKAGLAAAVRPCDKQVAACVNTKAAVLDKCDARRCDDVELVQTQQRAAITCVSCTYADSGLHKHGDTDTRASHMQTMQCSKPDMSMDTQPCDSSAFATTLGMPTCDGVIRNVGLSDARLQLTSCFCGGQQLRDTRNAARQLVQPRVHLQDLAKRHKAVANHCCQVAHGEHRCTLQEHRTSQ